MAKPNELRMIANPQAEMCVIGAMMLSLDACENAIVDLTESDFTEKAYRAVFGAIKRLVMKNIRADLVTVSTELGLELYEIGGSALLSQMIESVPGAANYPYYAKILKDYSKLRELQRYFSTGIDSIQTRLGTCTPEGLIDEIERGFDSIALDNKRNASVNMKQAVDEVTERIERAIANGDKICGIPTGFPILDDHMGGLEGGQFIVIGARPKIGKTSFVLDIALKCGVPVLYISLEMVTRELTTRMLSKLSGIPFKILDRPKYLTAEFKAKLDDAKDRLKGKRIEIIDKSPQTLFQIKTAARRAKRNKGIELLIVDHLQLVTGDNLKDNRVQELSKISAGLKELAKELDITTIVLSQLTRMNDREKRRPRDSDLRDSGTIEQDADVIWFLHRSTEEQAEILTTEMIISKFRNGAPGILMYDFYGKTMEYRELERHTNF